LSPASTSLRSANAPCLAALAQEARFISWITSGRSPPAIMVANFASYSAYGIVDIWKSMLSRSFRPCHHLFCSSAGTGAPQVTWTWVIGPPRPGGASTDLINFSGSDS
jgi:hypothetical protein